MALKLSPATVVRLRKRYARGRVSMSTLARKYLITESQIGRILRGESRRHIDGPRASRRPLHTPQGERNGGARLTAQQIRAIRRRYARGGVTQTAVAEAYGVTSVAVAFIAQRKSWTRLA